MNEPINKHAWRYVVTAVVIGLLILVGCQQKEVEQLGVTNLDSLHLSDSGGTATPVLRVNQDGTGKIAEFLDGGTVIASFNDGGGLSLSSGVTGAVDLNGAALTLDDDADSTLIADTDDQLELALGGADVLTVTTSVLNLDDHSITQDVNTENIMLPSVLTVPIVYSTASGTVATIADGEIWLVHSVFVRTTTNFDCTGDDCTLIIGDGNDDNGFISAADANLQATFTEATGYAAGLFGIENGSGGAYTLDDGGPFFYGPSGAAETIDYTIGGTSPAAGNATIYVVYTRVQ